MNYEEADYLLHFGVPGMRWGHRKARPVAAGRVKSSSGKTNKSQRSSEEQKAVRKKRIKTAAKVGAAVAATALASYGASKLIKNKSMQIQAGKGEAAVKKILSQANGKSRPDLMTKANLAYDAQMKKGQHMNTRQAAKNVASYYKQKRKR